MEACSVRVDAKLLKSYEGKLVRIIGKCESFNDKQKTGSLNSNGIINVNMTMNEPLSVNKNYEIIGKVMPNNCTVSVYSYILLSDNIKFDICNNLVQYVHKVPELYYD